MPPSTLQLIIRGIAVLGRCAAAIAALGWGISSVGLVVPSPTAFDLLNGLGAGDLAYDPMIDYWLRMTAFAFTYLGLQFALVAIRWQRWFAFALMSAIFQIACGAVLLVSAMAIRPPSGNHRADIAFCLGSGLIMLAGLLAGRFLGPRDGLAAVPQRQC
jgi:hypothetical protein